MISSHTHILTHTSHLDLSTPRCASKPFETPPTLSAPMGMRCLSTWLCLSARLQAEPGHAADSPYIHSEHQLSRGAKNETKENPMNFFGGKD